MQGILPVLENIVAEAVLIVRHTVGHQLDQQIPAQHEDVQAAEALGGEHVVGHVHDAPGVIQLEIGVTLQARQRGAHRRQVGAGVNMIPQHVVQGKIDDQVAVGQHHIILTDVLEIVHDAAQSLHLAPEAAGVAPPLGIGEGRQQGKTAVVAAQVPAFAGAQMVQHTLALAVHDDAHIPDAGAHHVGQHKVHHAIVAPEGDGTVDAVLDQLPQPGFLLIGENDAVHTVHASTSP